MVNCFGLNDVKNFLKIPFLDLQREFLEFQLEQNEKEMNNERSNFVPSKEDYDLHLIKLKDLESKKLSNKNNSVTITEKPQKNLNSIEDFKIESDNSWLDSEDKKNSESKPKPNSALKKNQVHDSDDEDELNPYLADFQDDLDPEDKIEYKFVNKNILNNKNTSNKNPLQKNEVTTQNNLSELNVSSENKNYNSKNSKANFITDHDSEDSLSDNEISGYTQTKPVDLIKEDLSFIPDFNPLDASNQADSDAFWASSRKIPTKNLVNDSKKPENLKPESPKIPKSPKHPKSPKITKITKKQNDYDYDDNQNNIDKNQNIPNAQKSVYYL